MWVQIGTQTRVKLCICHSPQQGRVGVTGTDNLLLANSGILSQVEHLDVISIALPEE